jgi:glycosyltransferase involved in cell wall biosynthesis
VSAVIFYLPAAETEDIMRSIVVIPTYNEAVALPSLLERISELRPSFEVLVVDDASPDGTGKIADEFASRSEGAMRVLHRKGKLGLGSAYRDGFRRALEDGAELVFEMDADHSHNPKYLPAMRHRLESDLDVAIASRYVDGVRVENWPFRRLLLSRFANYYVNLATGMSGSIVSDATSGYRGYRREVLQAIGVHRVASNGYCFQVEMAFRAWRLGFRVGEVPITFEEHYLTSSKITKGIVWEAIWRTPLLRWTAPRNAAEAHRTPETARPRQ